MQHETGNENKSYSEATRGLSPESVLVNPKCEILKMGEDPVSHLQMWPFPFPIYATSSQEE